MKMEEAIQWMLKEQAKLKPANPAERKFQEARIRQAREVVEEKKWLEREQQAIEAKKERDDDIEATALGVWSKSRNGLSTFVRPTASAAIYGSAAYMTTSSAYNGIGTIREGLERTQKMVELQDRIRELEQQVQRVKENTMVLEPAEDRFKNERKFKQRDDSG